MYIPRGQWPLYRKEAYSKDIAVFATALADCASEAGTELVPVGRAFDLGSDGGCIRFMVGEGPSIIGHSAYRWHSEAAVIQRSGNGGTR